MWITSFASRLYSRVCLRYQKVELSIGIHGVCTHPGRDETAVQLLEKETLQTEDLPRLDLSKLMAGKKAPHHIGGQAVAPARDGDDVGTVALREGSY
jgi:hypothetical protein